MKREKMRQLSKTLLAILLLVIIGVQTPYVQAQTPSLNVPTSSITLTATPTITATATPTVSVTPEANMIITTAVGTQYPWNKKIPLKLRVTPKIEGKRLEIRWQSKASITGNPEFAIIQNPQAGQTYTFTFLLTPHGIGYQRAVADIILTTNTTNYVSSTYIPIRFDEKKVVIPVTTAYIFYQVVMYISLVVFFFIVLPFLIYQLYLYSKNVLIPKWLESRIKKPL